PGSTDQRNIHIPLTNERNTDNSTCRSYIKMEFVTALNVRSQEISKKAIPVKASVGTCFYWIFF
ncbi:MAG: hypothetical protein RBS73_13805, partial [Prolixibacteraceae bacterium]|nr:hypothetical protein [Prolixibacteraceae bacterium]